MSPKKNKGDNNLILVDGHVDLTYFMINLSEEIFLSALEEAPFTLKKIREVGLRLFFNALYCEDKYNGERSQQHLEQILQFTLDRFDAVTIFKGKGDLENLKKDQEMVGVLLLLENADALAGNLSYLDRLLSAGVRIVGLTHAGSNRLADGHMVLHSEGLTREGRELIHVLTEKSILVDIAHLHPKCFWQLLKLTEAPIISSHTGIKKVFNIQRNIDMEQAKEIIGRGGLIGITCNPAMLSPDGKANIEHVFIHLDTLVQKFGPDGVGLGSDFCGFKQPVEGLEDITKIPHLIEMMMNHGYGEEAVDKIMGLNWLRLFEKQGNA